jgi:hypothetical protein
MACGTNGRAGVTATPAAILFDRLHWLEFEDSHLSSYDRPIGLRMLYQDPGSSAEHYLVRYPAGLRAGHHRHSAAHTIIVLDGTMEANGQLLHAGLQRSLPSGRHDAPRASPRPALPGPVFPDQSAAELAPDIA